jgi:hypothetical protein
VTTLPRGAEQSISGPGLAVGVAPEPEVRPLPPPPRGIDPLVEWLESASNGLVLLEAYRLEDLGRMVREVASIVRDHGREFDVRLGPEPPAGQNPGTWALLRADHSWFAVSLEQLAWFFDIVEREDHGGHRQALGQYGRLLAESLRRHRATERAYLPGAP